MSSRVAFLLGQPGFFSVTIKPECQATQKKLQNDIASTPEECPDEYKIHH